MKNLFYLFFVLANYLSFASTNYYRVTWRDNPATTMVVGWNQVSGSNATVYYGTVDQGTNWNAYPSSQTVSRSVTYKGMNNQFARLTGLQPNTPYYYVIKDSEGISQRFWFKTTPDNPNERLAFIAGGDSRNNRTPRVNANKLVSKLRPHAVFFGGDMTNGDSNGEWSEWFEDWQHTIGTDGRIIPIVAARGNHEDSNNSIYNLFDVPSTNIYFALTFGGNLVRAYTLNSEISITGSQTTWLENDLAAEQNVFWKMAQYHKPMRPHVSTKSEGNSQYASWSNLFYQHSVRLVVECDAHTVKTTWPVKPSTGTGNDEGFIQDDENGTVYVGEGCWGAPLRTNNDEKSWTRASGKFNQFKWIFVDQQKIECRTIKVDNAASVGTVSDANIFAAPSNLDIWSPSTGSVVVIENTTPLPLISLTNPTNNQLVQLNETITLTADATAPNGSIIKVEFFVNNQKVGEDLTAPYEMDWIATDNGSYEIHSIVTDNNQQTATSKKVTILVGKITTSQNIQISDGNDDVEENGNTGGIYFDSSDLELVADGSKGNQIVGLRFQNLPIPQGATIKNAYLQFTCDEVTTTSTSLTISGHDVDNSPLFQNLVNDVSKRTLTTQKVTWSPNTWNTKQEQGINQKSPSVVSIVQEIVNRTHWNLNNAMTFIIQGTGERTAESYEGNSNEAPILFVEYDIENNTVLPQISITKPSVNEKLNISQKHLFKAIATDQNGTVEKVKFYINDLEIGEGVKNGDEFSIEWMPLNTGKYLIKAKVINSDEKQVTSEIIEFEVTNVITETSNVITAQLITYPNPASNSLFIQSNSFTEPVTIQIIDEQGNVILTYKTAILTESVELDIQDLIAGRYMLYIHNNIKSKSASFIKI